MWKKAEKRLLKDIYIGPLIIKYGHCKIKKKKKRKYFESLVLAIVNQQLSGKAASTIFERLKKEIGGKVTPDNILRKRDLTLRGCGLSYAKIGYIKDLSSKVKSKRLKLEKLERLSDTEIIEELIQVKGIGKWTAEMFLMFSLARCDIFPVDDLGIRKGFAKTIGKNISRENMAKFAERWKPDRTIASWYLWRTVDN